MTEYLNKEIFKDIEATMRDFFDDYDGPITADTTAEDIPQWDSLAHVQLLVIIEQKHGIRFSTSEISQLRKLSDLVQLVEKKKG